MPRCFETQRCRALDRRTVGAPGRWLGGVVAGGENYGKESEECGTGKSSLKPFQSTVVVGNGLRAVPVLSRFPAAPNLRNAAEAFPRQPVPPWKSLDLLACASIGMKS
jgi:hypothetical protein